MHSFYRCIRAGLIVTFSLMLASCGGGGSAPAGTTVISGIVFDDAIAGATVTATSVDSGLVLGRATTAADGSFSLNVITSQIGTGYTLSSSGGTMNGLPFNSNLSAIYPATANTQQSNVTLLTSALSQAANTTTQFSGTLLQKQLLVIASAINRGLIGPDYYLVQPSGTLATALHNQATTTGVSTTISGQANIYANAPAVSVCNPTDTTCTQDVSSWVESLSMSFQGALVSAPAGALSGCRVVASFDASAQSMTLRLENIIVPTNLTQSNICQIAGDVSLTLPSSTAQAPDACSPTAASSIHYCVPPIDSGFTPSYLVDGGDGYQHRTDKNPHSSTPVLGRTVKLSRSYGAVLSSSTMPLSGAAVQNQWQGKNAVIFVHGYTLGEGFGGNDGTWGELPKLVTEDPSFVALNFQWKTDASYLTVAAELAKAVDYAYLSTGNKVHIVAHSFGGVLSRVMLQNLNKDPVIITSASNVATLTTVGTPHSGIVNVKGGMTVEGQTLPEGWGSGVPGMLPDILQELTKCGQISCYQSGLDAAIADWAKRDLACPAGITNCPKDSIPMRGYINARLADFATYSFPQGLKVNVLIGQMYLDLSCSFMNGDYLISYFGQRFKPDTGYANFLSDKSEGGATVTEQLLGCPKCVNAAPDLFVNISDITPYMFASNYLGVTGYKHNLMVGVGPPRLEVNVPADCGTADTCKHDTWVNLNEFLHANVTPSAPTGISATAGNGQATISWSAVAGATSYNLYMASVSGVTKSNFSSLADGIQHTGVSSLYTQTGLTNDKPYYFVVTAVNGYGESIESSQVSVTPPLLVVPTTIAASGSHSHARKSDGSLWAWGYNQYGVFGNGTTTSSSTPVQASLTSVIATAAGWGHTLAIKDDGTVWAWGSNYAGQLGIGTATYPYPSTPVQVSGLTGVIAVSAGYDYSLALKGDGTVWAWGFNGNGQLGDGNNITYGNNYSTTPTQVVGLTGVTAIAASRIHSLALKGDGTVWAWGHSPLGNGGVDSSTPVQASGLTGITAIATNNSNSEDFSLALKGDGTVWAWGANTFGQLGIGTADTYPYPSTPVQVSGLTGVTAIAAGDRHSLALKGDGTVWAWGSNSSGRLGNGTTTDSYIPVQVSGLTGATAIAGGEFHSIALKGNGTVWAWGSNSLVQLGNGTTTDSYIPVQVIGF